MSGCIDKGCNSSFITMVPKIHDPNTINDYRPISLIGSLYKTSKDSRRKVKVVHLVVSPSQTTFIKNRNILDDPLVLNEVISWIKKSKKKDSTFKFDFERLLTVLVGSILTRSYNKLILVVNGDHGFTTVFPQLGSRS